MAIEQATGRALDALLSRFGLKRRRRFFGLLRETDESLRARALHAIRSPMSTTPGRPLGVPVHVWGQSVGIKRRRIWAWPLFHERDAAYERRIERTLYG